MDTDPLEPLIGTWEGTGEGGFPTMEDFEYREHLEIRRSEAGPALHYVQETWRGDAGSHYETGFITASDDGTIRWLSAQGEDRVEVLEGVVEHGDAVHVKVHSVAIAGDDRMIRSWRTLDCAGDELTYSMGMATTATPDDAPHISAHLTRR